MQLRSIAWPGLLASLLLVTGLEAAAPTGPPGVGTAEARVHALLASQDWRQALEHARRTFDSFPGDLRARSLLAEALWRAGEATEARKLLEATDDPRSLPPRGRMVLARILDARGRRAEAETLMQSAAADAGDDREVLYWAAQVSPSRAETVRLLERYLALSEGDDPDRIEAVQGRIRLFRGLGERAVWVAEKRPERLELPLTQLWDPATRVTTGYVVRPRFGPKNKVVPLLLDSGSPGLFVVHRVARKRGFRELAELTVYGGGGNRRHATRRGVFSSVALGDLRFTEALATTTEREVEATGRFNGYVGLSVFQGYEVVLDLADRVLRLGPAGPPLDGAPYWDVGGQWLVRAEVGEGESGLFLFDTGATHTAISAELAGRLDRARPGEAVAIQGFGGTLEGARSLSGVEVRFQGLSTGSGDLRVLDLELRSRLGGVEISGFLGLDLLGGRRIVVDTRSRTLTVGE